MSLPNERGEGDRDLSELNVVKELDVLISF